MAKKIVKTETSSTAESTSTAATTVETTSVGDAPVVVVTKPKRAKRTKASSIDDVIQMLRDQKVDKAIVALEKLKDSLVAKKERKPRAPTPFNMFVSEKMAQLKESGMTTNERMKECARLWKEEKAKVPK